MKERERGRERESQKYGEIRFGGLKRERERESQKQGEIRFWGFEERKRARELEIGRNEVLGV